MQIKATKTNAAGWCFAALAALMMYAPAHAAPPVCPTPSQGYEITGCFVDDSGDEFAAGGTVDVYDLAFDQSLTDTFAMGTFVVDAFTVAPPSTPPASCGTCGAVDFCVVATFNDVPAGTPTPQTFCADGNLTVNDGGFDLRGLTGGAPAVVTVPAPTYSVGGTVTGLAGTGLVLQNNGGDDLALAADGAFQFSQALVDGAAYNVTVSVQPGGPVQECTVTNGAGTLASADVTNVNVSCETLNAELSISKSDGGVTNVAPGATLNYALTVTNNGPLDSTGGTVTDVLPAGLTFVSSSTGCTEAAGTVTCAFGTIPAAGNTVLEFVAEVDGGQTADISNTATVSGNEPDDVGGNDSSTVVTSVAQMLEVGGTVTGLEGTGLTLQNNGGDDLVITVDGMFVFSQALVDGSAYDVSVSVQPDSPAQECTVTNGAGTLAGADVTNVSVECETLVADLAIAKSDGGVADVAPGATLNYALTVTNNGPLDSTGGTVTDVLPAGLTFVSSSTGCTEAAGTVTCAFGAIPAAGNMVLEFVAEVDGAQTADISNTATVSGNEPDDVAGNDSSTIVTPLLLPVQRESSAPLPSGDMGTIMFTTTDSGCTFREDPVFTPAASVSPSPPDDLVFVDGVVSFVIERCQPGAAVVVTVDYAKPVDADAQFWKAGSPWFALPSTVMGTAIRYEIVDGGMGDSDGSANGSIVDPGGAAYQVVPARPAVPVPAFSIYALFAMVLMFSLIGLARLPRR